MKVWKLRKKRSIENFSPKAEKSFYRGRKKYNKYWFYVKKMWCEIFANFSVARQLAGVKEHLWHKKLAVFGSLNIRLEMTCKGSFLLSKSSIWQVLYFFPTPLLPLLFQRQDNTREILLQWRFLSCNLESYEWLYSSRHRKRMTTCQECFQLLRSYFCGNHQSSCVSNALQLMLFCVA